MQTKRLLVSMKELKSLGICYSPAHIARLEKQKKFPARVRLGACRVAWCYDEVCDWVNERIAERDRALER